MPMTPAPVRYQPDLEVPETDEAETDKRLRETLHRIMETTSQDYGHAVRGVHATSHGLLEGELKIPAGLHATHADRDRQAQRHRSAGLARRPARPIAGSPGQADQRAATLELAPTKSRRRSCLIDPPPRRHPLSPVAFTGRVLPEGSRDAESHTSAGMRHSPN
jgi:hypothetical protein